MRIRWTNDARTRAVITVGLLWWKRRAMVFRLDSPACAPDWPVKNSWWAFEFSRRALNWRDSRRLETSRDFDQDWTRADWRGVGMLPAARVAPRSTPSSP